MEQFKTCSKCKRKLPVTSFYKAADMRDGFQSKCKVCKNIVNRNWAETNQGRKNATSRQWNKENRERCNVASAMWRKRNPEKYRVILSKYHSTHKEQRNAASRLWWTNNKHTTKARPSYEKARAHAREATFKQRNELADYYMKRLIRLLTGIALSDIPESMINAKRAHLKVKRLIKEKQK